jgi:uncharacterized protein YndB with AHSA1/START domain
VNVEINEDAPVISKRTVEVAADPQTVWDVLAAIDEWPIWNSDVKSASLEGELARGSRFRWKAGPGTITSTLVQVDPPRLIGWLGKTLGINAVHVYRLEPQEGGTRVTSEESYEGLPVRLMHGRMQKMLDDATESGLQSLKVEAERRRGMPPSLL